MASTHRIAKREYIDKIWLRIMNGDFLESAGGRVSLANKARSQYEDRRSGDVITTLPLRTVSHLHDLTTPTRTWIRIAMTYRHKTRGRHSPLATQTIMNNDTVSLETRTDKQYYKIESSLVKNFILVN